MAALVTTVSKPSDVQGFALSNKKARFFDISTDTGDYSTGGFTVQASSFGLKHIDIVIVGAAGATSGTAGATLNPIGVRYGTGGTSVIFQVYEAAATGLVLLEKTNAEAQAANFTFRILVIGS